jgi:hypothetical protein
LKPRVLVALAAFSLVTLSACGSANTASGLAGVPGADDIGPLMNKVMITARHAGKPIPHLEITLRRNAWPTGKLIAKGATGVMGRVTLSGNWTAKDVICAGGTYYTRQGSSTSYSCEQPFPRSVTLEFR